MITVAITAAHTGTESVAHTCRSGSWPDPTDYWKFTREYATLEEYKKHEGDLQNEAMRDLLSLAQDTGYCACHKLLRPIMGRWATDVELRFETRGL